MRKIEKDWSSVNTMQSRVEVGMKVTLPPRSAALISGRKWWPPKAVENFRGAEVVTMVVQCRCTRSCFFPPLWVEPMFQSGPPPTNPLFQTLVKTTFSQRNFSRASTFASSSSFEEHRWKNWTIFWNFEIHFGESLNFDSEGKIFSPMQFWIFTNILLPRARNTLWAMITDSQILGITGVTRFFKVEAGEI